jgi:predicted DNA binding CopG/RHH family protein
VKKSAEDVGKKKVRVRNLTIRISSEDYDTLVVRAEEAGMTQSEYVRFLIRRARIRVSVEV